MPISKKFLFKATLSFLLILILISGLWFFLNQSLVNSANADNNVIFPRQDNGGNTIVALISGPMIESNKKEELKEQGYIVNYPQLIPMRDSDFYWKWNNEAIVTMQDPIIYYASELLFEYEYYVKLDYTVEVTENKTVEITFFGFGYRDEGKGEPVPLYQEFIFDISDVSNEKMPVLIHSYPIEDVETVFLARLGLTE
ncbi:MAG: hypothetical protein FWG44_01375 [Oscillospiraceae bacterium]|nr:hypothetical protein [Oscillospiraceae bacterium]